jgi:hypothetical protein
MINNSLTLQQRFIEACERTLKGKENLNDWDLIYAFLYGSIEYPGGAPAWMFAAVPIDERLDMLRGQYKGVRAAHKKGELVELSPHYVGWDQGWAEPYDDPSLVEDREYTQKVLECASE